MAYLVLARKYRPETFETFVGQDVIAATLRNAIRMDRVAHAYLFCGPRGVGKTSMARVFAKALNCAKGPTTEPCGKCEQCKAIAAGQDVDVIEIDGASNNGVEQVRDLRQNARYAPAHSRSKIYYIDEVHMLSMGAFNALLKTLEEPPPHVKFIFATTGADKLPDTILSRVQRFDFRRISNLDILRKLHEICKAEKLGVAEDVLALVARRARGSMRDALSLLDEIIPLIAPDPTAKKAAAKAAAAESGYEKVAALLGTLGDEEMARLMKLIQEKDAAGLLKTVAEWLGRGMDVGELLDELVGYARDLLVGKTCGPDPDLLDRPPDGAAALVAAGKDFSADRLLYIAEILNNARRRIREGQDDRIVLEMALVKLAQADGLAPISELIERLAALEESATQPLSRPISRPAAAPPVTREAPPRAAWRAEPRPKPESDTAPAVREEAPSSTPSSPPGDLEDLWNRLVEEVNRTEKDNWLSIQLGGGHLQRVGDAEVVIAFPADRGSMRQELEKQDNRRKLQTILGKLLNRSVTLRLVTVADGPARDNPRETAISDPAIQELVRKSDGRVIS